MRASENRRRFYKRIRSSVPGDVAHLLIHYSLMSDVAEESVLIVFNGDAMYANISLQLQ